jgi:hypothetical protein
MDTVPVEYRMCFLMAWPEGSLICDLGMKARTKRGETLSYPEIDVQVATSANLVRNSHLERYGERNVEGGVAAYLIIDV